MLLRKPFTLPRGTTAGSVRVAIAIDNDVRVFVNGIDISGGLRSSEYCAVRDRFVFRVHASVLNPNGDDLPAIRARDRGSASYVDAGVRADVAQVPQVASVGGER